MTVEAPWFHVVPCPLAAVGVRPFVLGGQLRIGVVVKLGLEIAHPVARLTTPSAIALEDCYPSERALGSITSASDLALRKQACDVTLTGVARTPGGQPAQTLPVRLAVFRGNAPLLRKAVVATGPANAAGVVEPITAMPLTYERAIGGPELPANPVGSSGPSLRLTSDASQPGCFGPVAASWPVRRGRLTAPARTELLNAVPAVAEPLDWTYFQSAPPDQIVPYLVGGEWLLVDGISATWPRIQTQLPVFDLQAFLVPRSRPPVAIPLVCDTLAIAGETLHASAVFRGDVASPASIRESRELAIVVRLSGGTVLPSPEELFAADNLVAALHRDPGMPLGNTKGLSVIEHESASKQPVAPYAIGQRAGAPPAGASPPHAPGAPWNPAPAPRVIPAGARNATVPLSTSDLVPPAPAPLLPIQQVPQALAPSPSMSAPFRAAPATAPAFDPLAAPPAPPAMLAMPPGDAPRKQEGPKPPSRIELAEAALRGSGMSEERLAEVLRDLQREIGST